ncbi:MAG: hypothetical protein O2819_01315 [Planctomycetota bacterium]|nr:hypothetical protein [Planctomycetota bacterium]MDA1104989.1 hypothetical protein [Planctomycetota bacterium]
MPDRVIQLFCLIVAFLSLAAGSTLLPKMLRVSDQSGMRFTDVSVEGAPPIVALGQAIGALRGIIVDYLWIKAMQQKQEGLFFEAMSDAALITTLQPRFGEVWGFHGHNMAYNISVLTNTPEERWEWVKAGVDLVRNQGLRYNPNDLWLHKELAFWFSHKIDGVADDAHFHYKRELAREWHFLLGEPPGSHSERIAWIDAIATAPDTLAECDAAVPGTSAVLDDIRKAVSGFDSTFAVKPDAQLLRAYGQWESVQASPTAKMLGLDQAFKQNDQVYRTFDQIFADPARKDQVVMFVRWLRKKVLREEYNMEPALMSQYTREFGPFDWRHPQSHTFYWARKGSTQATRRFEDEDDIYKVLNNDRLNIHAMQALERSGLMRFDPFANDNPTRLTDPRWIKVIDNYFHILYQKHYGTRGAGGDTFIDFYENFMASAIRELYRAGDIEGAQQILDKLDRLFGRGGFVPNNKYEAPLDVFVRNITYGEYEYQPEAARSDVYNALRRGFREGLLLNRKQVLDSAITFAEELTEFFQGTRYTNFVNKFGERRMADLVSDIRTSIDTVFLEVLLDQSQPIIDRLTIYNRAGEAYQRAAYDAAHVALRSEYERTVLAKSLPFDRAFPEPPGMEAYRAFKAAEAERAGAGAKENDMGSERR